MIAAMLVAIAVSTGALAAPRMVVDVETGAVIEHEDAFKRWYPASLTKLMTGYVAFRAMEAGTASPTSPVTLSPRAAAEPPSKMFYGEGATLTLDTALKIIMVKSANDVATAIGESLAGSQSAFVAMMNAEADRLGMTGTRFINAHGLPGEGQYTTARDMAVLARAIRREFPEYGSYFDIEAIRSGETVYPNFNMLIGRFPGATGMKTGFICSSGFNQVSSARRGEREVVSVVFGARSLADRAEQSAQLLDAGLSQTPSGKPRIGELEPYGENRDLITDLRPEICNAEAAAERAEGRDDEGELIIQSDLIRPLTRDLVAEPVALGGTGGIVALIDADVPVPTPSPRRAELGDAGNAPSTLSSFADTTDAPPAAAPEAPPRPLTANGLRPSLSVPIPTPRPQP